MGFFFNQARTAKPAPVQRHVIPIEALQKLGCKACPRDKHKLVTPKFEPYGSEHPLFYLLSGAPSEEEDERGAQWADPLGDEVMVKLRSVRQDIRWAFTQQCHDGLDKKEETTLAVECCRSRVTEDIERLKPLVVAGVGDAPLKWATGLSSALHWRGQPIATRIGSHSCWYYPLISPFYALKRKKSSWVENEMALRIDSQRLIEFADSQPEAPVVYTGPYDTGIEIITGQEPGDLDRLTALLQEMVHRSSAIDIETSGLRAYLLPDPKIHTVAIGTFEKVVAFSLDHPDGWQTAGQRQKVEELLLWYLWNAHCKIAHNLAFEMEWFGQRFGLEVLRRTRWEDTMALWHSLNERKGTKSLDDQCRVHFGFFLKDQGRVKPDRLLEFPLREVLRYNGMDAKWTHALALRLFPEVTRVPAFRRDYERKIETAVTLIRMESRGLPIDFKYTEDQNDRLRREAKELEHKIADCKEVRAFEWRFHRPLRPSTPDDVLTMLRDICQRHEIQRLERDGSTKWTTDEEALASIPRSEVPSAPLILEHRGVLKLLGTYIEPVLARRIVCADGKIRSKYSTMEAETSRLASEDPNAQNWPKRKHVEIRGMVYVGHGLWLVAVDFGQIEFRVVGMASEDETLVKYCWTGYDVHKAWATRMIEVYPAIQDWVLDEFADAFVAAKKKQGSEYDEDKVLRKLLRQEAKNGWVFPQLFGSTTRSCAERLHLPEDIADDLGAEFWDEFKGTKKWQDKVLRHYEKNLWVETLGGRRRRGPLSRNQIINHPIQGTTAEIVIDAMNAVSVRAELLHDPYVEPVLNVHDDLTYIMPDDDKLMDRIEGVVFEMCKPRHSFVNVPLVVEVSIGARWSELKEIGVYRSDVVHNIENPYAAA